MESQKKAHQNGLYLLLLTVAFATLLPAEDAKFSSFTRAFGEIDS